MSYVIPFNYEAMLERQARETAKMINDLYDLNMVEFDEESTLAVVLSLFSDANDNEPSPAA